MVDLVYRTSRNGIVNKTEVNHYSSLIRALAQADRVLQYIDDTNKIHYMYIVDMSSETPKLIKYDEILDLIKRVNNISNDKNV